MRKFKFTSTSYIEAETEDEAREKFADESWTFAENADVEEVEDEDIDD